jgi:hypothetical protein
LVLYIYNASSQWDTGEEKRDKIKNTDIESIPVPLLSEKGDLALNTVVNEIEKVSDDYLLYQYEDNLDELIFDLYNLKEYEKEIIREFYQIKVERTGIKRFVNHSDIKSYISKFSEVFELMLDDKSRLVANL